MYLAKTPSLLKNLYPQLIWDLSDTSDAIYLTFDDGPIPEVTPWVLETLDNYQVKATFFCIGNNVEKNPDIYYDIIQAGHAVGNHSYSHLSGWRSSSESYLNDIAKAEQIIDSKLFRPPYGKIRKKQIDRLKSTYKIIMWDILSGDFDQRISAERCFQNVVKNVSAGSIIVFHDSLKAEERLKYALPRVIENLSAKAFHFETL